MDTSSGRRAEAFASALATAMRAERGAARMTFDELADRSGIPKRSLVRYLNGERPIDMGVLAKIATGLATTPLLLVEAAEKRVGDWTTGNAEDDVALDAIDDNE